VCCDDELRIRKLVLEKLADPSTVLRIDRHNYIVKNAKAEAGPKDVLQQGQIEAQAHPILVAFAVKGTRWEHALLVEVNRQI
jgi:hypothetical protein